MAPCPRPILYTEPGQPSIKVCVHHLQLAFGLQIPYRMCPDHLPLWMHLMQPSAKQRWRRRIQNRPMAKLQVRLAGWLAELLQHAPYHIQLEDGHKVKVWMLAPILAAFINACFM